MRMILLISLPAAAALLILAEPILITLFHYGALTDRDVAMASLSLRAYSLGLLPFMMIKILAPGFYAQQNTKTPVKIGIVAMVANMVLNIALVLPLHFYYEIGHVGLALATFMSACLNAFLLFRGLKMRGVYQAQKGFWVFLLRVFFSTLAMSAALLLILQDAAVWLQWAWFERVLQLGQMVVLGVACYVGCLFLLGFRHNHARVSHK
jgi:putative peptidoglycan lipid II flippase